MIIGVWRQRLLVFLSLVFIVVPLIGLPALIKTSLVVGGGLVLIVAALTLATSQSNSTTLNNSSRQAVELLPPEPVLPADITNKSPAIMIVSPIKPRAVKRRRTKVVKSDSRDYAPVA